MRALFNGCSFVWGDELQDPMNSRFSKLISDNYELEENNLAIRGASNDRIFRTTIDYLQGYIPEIAIIVWSGIDRMEYLNHREQDAHDDYYLQCSPSRIGQKEFKVHDNTLTKYYSHIATDMYSSIKTLGYMNTIQLICQSMNVPVLQFQFAHRHRGTLSTIINDIPINPRMDRFLEYYKSKVDSLKEYSTYGLLNEQSLLELSKSIGDVEIGKNWYGHPLEKSQILFKDMMIKELERHYDFRIQ